MDINSILLLLGYHNTYDPFKYELMLEIIFLKNMLIHHPHKLLIVSYLTIKLLYWLERKFVFFFLANDKLQMHNISIMVETTH